VKQALSFLALLFVLSPAASHAQVATPAGTISGVVLEPDGQPAQGAKVVLVAGDMMTAPVLTDANGHFSIAAWSSGEALVYAHEQGKSARYRADAPPASSVTLQLVEPGTIKGTLRLPEGLTAADFMGYIGPAKIPALLPGIWWGPRATFSGNEFTIENVPAGDIQVHVASQSLAMAGHAQVRVEPKVVATIIVDMQAARSSVAGSVLNASTRQTIAGYQAFLLLADSSPEAWYMPGQRFAFVTLTAGDRVVLITAPGYRSKRVSAHLVEGETTDLGQVLLEPTSREQATMPARNVSGVVLEPDGQPAQGAKVVVVANDMMTEPVLTDVNGHFSIAASPSGEALVYAHEEGKTARLSAATPPDAAVTLQLVEPGTIKGTLRIPEGATAGDFMGYIGPAKVAALLPGIWWGPKATFSGTEFTIENVPAGDIQVHVASRSLAMAGHAQVRVEPKGVSRIAVDVQRAESAVEGRVFDAVARQEIPRFQAFLLLADGSPEAWYPTGPTFAFTQRTPGDRIVLIAAPGYKSQRIPAHLDEGQRTDVGQVLLEPASVP